MADRFDTHFLILSPELPGVWFTQGALEYWLRFQPIVSSGWDILAHLPPDRSAAVTLLARPEDAEAAKEAILAQADGVFLDVVVAGSLPALELILNERADAGLPFGQ